MKSKQAIKDEPVGETTAWLVAIDGDPADLRSLAENLHEPSVKIVKRTDGYFVQLAVSASSPMARKAGEIASSFVELMNSAAVAANDSRRPVTIDKGGIVGIDANGNVTSQVILPQTGRAVARGLRARIVSSGDAGDSEPLAVTLLRSAEQSQARADALRLVGRRTPTWSELYVAFELAQTNAGARIHSRRWASSSDIKCFKRTANSYTALGRFARHGRDGKEPPKAPMEHRAAVALIRTLVVKWLAESAPKPVD